MVTPSVRFDFWGSPNKGGQNQKSKRTLGVTMMLLVSKRGFKDCPGFLNSTARLGPKRGRFEMLILSPLHSRGSPNKGGQNQKSKRTNDAPSIKAWIQRLRMQNGGRSISALFWAPTILRKPGQCS